MPPAGHAGVGWSGCNYGHGGHACQLRRPLGSHPPAFGPQPGAPATNHQRQGAHAAAAFSQQRCCKGREHHAAPTAPLCHAPCFRSHHVPLADSGHPGPRRVRSHAQRLQQRHTGPGRQQAQHGGAHAPRCERIPGPWRERAVGLVAWAGGRGQHAPASGGALPATFAAATTARASTAGAHRSCTAPAPAVAPVHHGAHAAAGAAAAAAAANGAGHADCPPQQGGAEHGGHANGWLTARLARVCA
mmetsp:Transcript_11601/g.31591  ORF Transcript_11601/g.31591 Transcript_11601/m.31591 type:complete len:245 (+) Transcript_11601:3081-3815(+)